ncbi:hypothetical protein ABZX38_36005, partial [Streptomyces longwoodensis]|uniref:hypothetical protein n=1 Tax=Streptomyces longwoodensis TaxID=68231 RepID=UPI0033AD694A
TVASFVLTRETLSRLSSGRFPSVLRFRLYQIIFLPDSLSAGLPQTYSLSLVGLSTFTTLADSPGDLIIEIRGFEFERANTSKATPLRGSRW